MAQGNGSPKRRGGNNVVPTGMPYFREGVHLCQNGYGRAIHSPTGPKGSFQASHATLHAETFPFQYADQQCSGSVFPEPRFREAVQFFGNCSQLITSPVDLFQYRLPDGNHHSPQKLF